MGGVIQLLTDTYLETYKNNLLHNAKITTKDFSVSFTSGSVSTSLGSASMSITSCSYTEEQTTLDDVYNNSKTKHITMKLNISGTLDSTSTANQTVIVYFNSSSSHTFLSSSYSIPTSACSISFDKPVATATCSSISYSPLSKSLTIRFRLSSGSVLATGRTITLAISYSI